VEFWIARRASGDQTRDGIVLAMPLFRPSGACLHFPSSTSCATVNYGWLIRYLHTTGASMFFAVVYVHIFS